MGNVMDARRRILLNTPHIETASGGVANFKTDMIAPLKECKVNFLPKQSGSGDPSPTNIRPISGWDGVTVYQTGVNVWDGEIENGGIDDTTGEKISASHVRSANYIPVKQNANYYASFADVVGGGGLWAYAYDFDKNFIGRMRPIDIGSGNSTANKVFKTLDGTSYMLIKMQGGTRYDHISINYPSTDTQYHPYTASTFPISWTQQGTVYGGHLDLVSGELWKEWAYTDLGEVTYSKIDRSEFYYFQALRCLIDGKLIYNSYTSTIKCEKYKTVRASDINGGISGNFAISMYDTKPPGVRIRDDSYSTPEALQAALKGTMVYYELETPQLIAILTPQQIKAVKGINNVYSDVNDITEVKFWTH